MDKKAKAEKIRLILDHLYPDPPIPLQHTSHYTLLIAVLLSAQCTDARVNKITPFLFEKASIPEEMILLETEEIQEIIRPCGLSPKKARAIKELSHLLIEKHGGQVPKSFDDLEALPGVGHKTASVVMAQAFKTPAFPVDTHIQRSAIRWGLSEGKSVSQVEKDLKKLYAKKYWTKLHLQIIYFARQYCPARCHNAQECPICSFLQN